MGKFRLVYGKDPHAAERGGAFFWPGNEQLRRQAEAVKRLDPEAFETIYQCNPAGAAKIRQQRAEAQARLAAAHKQFVAAAERLVAAHGAHANAPVGDAKTIAAGQLAGAARDICNMLICLGVARPAGTRDEPAVTPT